MTMKINRQEREEREGIEVLEKTLIIPFLILRGLSVLCGSLF
jgi:hypothetical protein